MQARDAADAANAAMASGSGKDVDKE